MLYYTILNYAMLYDAAIFPMTSIRLLACLPSGLSSRLDFPESAVGK
jgi:hypothetical protein